ncbi:MAG: hypothetical protein LBJ90_06000 [Treponema sp.]|nr:hypothetical protein [Treponema sp.]
MNHRVVFAVSGLLALFLPALVFAHGVEVFDETGKPEVHTVRFMYTGGESMLFAKIKVFPPSSPNAAAQESVADRYGYFSFIPFESGEWRITAEDGMGHRGEIFIPVAGGAAAETAEAERNTAPADTLPRPVAIVLGVSLILNGFVFWYLMGKRLKKPAAAHAH